jgi:hypothetical protein
VKRYEKYGRNPSWIVKRFWKIQKKIVKWYGKYGWNMKWYGKYGRKVSRIVKWYVKYGRKASRMVEWFGKYGRKLWKVMEIMKERSVE